MSGLNRSLVLGRGAFVALSLLVISGCGDDIIAPDLGNGIDGSVTMQIDGTSWTATFATASNQGGIVGIGAGDTQGVGFGFAFVGTTTGTYSVGPTLANNATYSEGSLAWSAVNTQGSGTISVTTLTADRVAGTFTFEVEAVGTHTPATKSLTSGTFDIPLS